MHDCLSDRDLPYLSAHVKMLSECFNFEGGEGWEGGRLTWGRGMGGREADLHGDKLNAAVSCC